MPKKTRQSARKHLFFRQIKRITHVGFSTVVRVLLLFLMLGLLVCCGAWIIFVRAFNAQHISEVITRQLEEKLNRPVMISSLDLKFINTLELKGFYVVDTVGEPGKAFVSADSVTLHFDLFPLLEKKFVIHEVTLNAPRFNFVCNEKGIYNVPRVKMSDKPTTYTSAAGKKFTVSIEDWSIKDGVLSFNDLVSGATHELSDINARFDNLRMDELSHFELSTVLRNQWKENISQMEIRATGYVNFANFNWRGFMLRNVKTQTFFFKNPIDIELDVDNMVEPSFKLSALIPAFSAKDVSIFGVDKLSFSVPVTTINAEGKLTDDYRKLALTDFIAQAGDMVLNAGGMVDFTQDPWVLETDFSTQFFTLPDKANLLPFLKRYELTGRASLGGQLARDEGKFTWPLLTVQADNVSGNFYGFKTYNITGEFQAKNNFDDLYARTKTGKVTVARSVFDKLQLSGTWRKGNLYAYIASTQLNGEDLKLRLRIDNLKKDNRQIVANLHFGNFDPMSFVNTVQDFVTVITPLTKASASAEVTGELAWLRNFRDRLPDFMPNFAGTLSAETFSSAVLSGNAFKAQFDLKGMSSGAKKLSGPIRLKLQNGVIHQMEKLAAEQEALNVTFQPFIMMHRMERAGSFSVGKVLRDVEVSELAGDVQFEHGNMQINNAYTVGPTISAAISGWTDWVKETFDLTIFTMFTNTSRSGVLAENLTDESGNPALAFRVSSSMLKPKLDMLRAKQASKTISAAQTKGVNTDFNDVEKFIQGDFHAKK